MEHVLRAYAGDIFFYFKVHEEPKPAIIYLSGFPSNGSYDDKINLLYEKGYNVFVPLYRGSFQSNGSFLERNPVRDLEEFYDYISKGKAIELYNEKEINFKNTCTYLYGSSYGGSMALGLAAVRSIDKIVLSGPVWSWDSHSEKEEDLQQLIGFVKRAFKHLYRLDTEDLQGRLREFEELKPAFYKDKINAELLVFHDTEDKVVNYKHTEKHARDLKSKVVKHNYGHNSVVEEMIDFTEGFLD